MGGTIRKHPILFVEDVVTDRSIEDTKNVHLVVLEDHLNLEIMLGIGTKFAQITHS